MEVKRAVSIYFSPTGGTRSIVRAVADALGAAEGLELDRTPFESRWTGAELRTGDVAVIGVPVYYGRAPKIMVEFFRYIEAKCIPAVLVAVYGNRAYEDALLELKDLSTKAGFLPMAAGAFVGRHSYTDKMGTGRPDSADLEKAAELGREARALLIRSPDPAALTLEVKGSFPYTPGSDMPIAPATDKTKCTACMRCAKGCPVLAINPADSAETDGWRCLKCARCVQTCPAGAKAFTIPAMREKVAVMEAMFAAPKAVELIYTK